MRSKMEQEHPLLVLALEDALALLSPEARQAVEQRNRKAVAMVERYKALDDAAFAAEMARA